MTLRSDPLGEVRCAELDASHHAAVAELGARVFGHHGWSVEELARDAARPVFVGWVALHDAAVVGYLLAHRVAGEGEILSVAVDRQAQRRGLGLELVRAAQAGCESLVLEVREDNAAARALYAAAGFASLDRRTAYYGDGVDAVVLRWAR